MSDKQTEKEIVELSEGEIQAIIVAIQGMDTFKVAKEDEEKAVAVLKEAGIRFTKI